MALNPRISHTKKSINWDRLTDTSVILFLKIVQVSYETAICFCLSHLENEKLLCWPRGIIWNVIFMQQSISI